MAGFHPSFICRDGWFQFSIRMNLHCKINMVISLTNDKNSSKFQEFFIKKQRNYYDNSHGGPHIFLLEFGILPEWPALRLKNKGEDIP